MGDYELSILKHCPMCGNTATIVYHDWHYEYRYGILCNKCKMQIRQDYKTEEEAIEAWNRRI